MRPAALCHPHFGRRQGSSSLTRLRWRTSRISFVFMSLNYTRPDDRGLWSWLCQWVRDSLALEVTMRFSRSERGYEGSFDSENLRVTVIPIQRITCNPPDVE